MTHDVFEAAIEIPGYVSEGLIGRGGMGAVYAAQQVAHQRRVAVKVLSEAYRDDPQFVARFRQEAALLAQLEHPHIVPMLDAGEANGVPFIVMRLIDGPNLRELSRLESLAPADVVALLHDVAGAVDFAHGRGVLHRDIKPHNMLVDHGGHVWLADFGLTKLALEGPGATATSHIAGTFDYLAPELAAGRSASVASDIYAFGVTAFQLLTGELPFRANHAAGTLNAHASARRPAASGINPELPREVDSILAGAIAVDPTARPESAAQFVERLDQALSGTFRSARPRWMNLPVVAQRPASGVGGTGLGSAEPASVLTSAETRDDLGATAPGAGMRRARSAGASPRRWAVALTGVLAVAAAVTAGLLAFLPGTGQAATNVKLTTLDQKVPTHYDYIPGHGSAGTSLAARAQVTVACRASADGQWYYRITSKPYSLQYYAPAKDFHNPGAGLVDPKIAVCDDYPEVVGNSLPTNTWSNYTIGGGTAGKTIGAFAAVHVICRVKGLKVTDGNIWWYRVGGAPWDGKFYVSADAFYNNGKVSGSLKGTKFVDLDVPLCS